MAKAKDNEKVKKTEEKIIAVEEALGKSEKFIEKNKNLLFYILLAIVVIVGGYLLYRKYVMIPREREAQSQMFVAQQYFAIDSLNLAMNGDENNMGFIDIIDEYGSTKAGNLAHYYLGVIYIKKGQFEEAIEQFEDFESDDQIIGPMAKGLTGDAYLELGETEKAAECYLEAAEMKDNDFTAPMYLMRAGWAYELLGNYKEAIKCYEKIRKEHVKSYEARDAEKYLARAKGLAGEK